MVTLSSTAADDYYFIYLDLYDSGTASMDRVNYNLTVNLIKYGGWNTTVEIPTNTEEVFSDYVLVVEKVGTVYTVYDYNTADVIISGKMKNRVFKNRVKFKN